MQTVAERRERFELVVLIAHSNESIIRHARDGSREWPAFAKYLEPFAPRQLALIACAAGGHAVAAQLFSALPRLDRIYASPEYVNVNLANLILAVAGYSMTGGRAKGRRYPLVEVHRPHGHGPAAEGLATARCPEWPRDLGRRSGLGLAALM